MQLSVLITGLEVFVLIRPNVKVDIFGTKQSRQLWCTGVLALSPAGDSAYQAGTPGSFV